MSYTLVSAAVLGFELAHLTGGEQVARVLLTGLTADTATLLRLATQTVAPRRTPAASLPIDDLVPATLAEREALLQLRAIRFTGGLALEELIRSDVLGADCPTIRGLTTQACDRIGDALTDAVLRAWSGEIAVDGSGLEPDWWGHWTGAHPVDLGPRSDVLHQVLDPLLAGDPRAVRTWSQARPADAATWAPAMNQACWAAHLSGRVRHAAAAQMLGVLAFRAAGLGAADVTAGTWSALSGVIQAMTVADLLDEASLETLTAAAGTSSPLTGSSRSW